jgi:hypothetical protein
MISVSIIKYINGLSNVCWRIQENKTQVFTKYLARLEYTKKFKYEVKNVGVHFYKEKWISKSNQLIIFLWILFSIF